MKIIPVKRGHVLDIYSAETAVSLALPYVDTGISAGFPSPADDFSYLSIDLNRELIKNKEATFFARVKGDSMKEAGLNDGDLLVIDRSLEPQDGKIAVCFIDGEFTVKRIKKEPHAVWLMPANENYKPIKVTEENQLIIWGIVTAVIKFV